MAAADNGHAECVRALLQAGAKVDAEDNVRSRCLQHPPLRLTPVCARRTAILHLWRPLQ